MPIISISIQGRGGRESNAAEEGQAAEHVDTQIRSQALAGAVSGWGGWECGGQLVDRDLSELVKLELLADFC